MRIFTGEVGRAVRTTVYASVNGACPRTAWSLASITLVPPLLGWISTPALSSSTTGTSRSGTDTPAKASGPLADSVDLTVWLMTEVRRPSTVESWTAVSVTVWATFQFADVNTSDSVAWPLNRIWPSPLTITVTTSVPVGARVRRTVYASVVPAS